MADPADRIHELKIDRSAPPAPARGRLWAALAAGLLTSLGSKEPRRRAAGA